MPASSTAGTLKLRHSSKELQNLPGRLSSAFAQKQQRTEAQPSPNKHSLHEHMTVANSSARVVHQQAADAPSSKRLSTARSAVDKHFASLPQEDADDKASSVVTKSCVAGLPESSATQGVSASAAQSTDTHDTIPPTQVVDHDESLPSVAAHENNEALFDQAGEDLHATLSESQPLSQDRHAQVETPIADSATSGQHQGGPVVPHQAWPNLGSRASLLSTLPSVKQYRRKRRAEHSCQVKEGAGKRAKSSLPAEPACSLDGEDPGNTATPEVDMQVHEKPVCDAYFSMHTKNTPLPQSKLSCSCLVTSICTQSNFTSVRSSLLRTNRDVSCASMSGVLSCMTV